MGQTPTYPVAGAIPGERAAMRAELNQLILQLAAAGVQLHGKFKWTLGEVYWAPFGFDFTCENVAGLRQAARQSSKLATDFSDMPGYDPWLAAGIKAEGYSQLGKTPFVHLDFAVNKPGLCRMYLITERGRHKTSMGMAISSYASDPIVRRVSRTLAALRLPLDKYGITATRVYGGPNSAEPEGFDFDVTDAAGLLRDARKIGPLALDDADTFEGKLSSGVTLGTGFREVGYGPRIHLEIDVTHRPGRDNGKGNVHIDLEGWVIGKDADGRAIYDWIHGITHHFPEDLLPGYIGRPLVGRWRNIEWRPSIGVEHGRERDEKDPAWKAKLGFVFRF